MSVLAMKVLEGVFVGEDIFVKILGREGCRRVTVGVEAPDEVKIRRGELDVKPKTEEHIDEGRPRKSKEAF